MLSNPIKSFMSVRPFSAVFCILIFAAFPNSQANAQQADRVAPLLKNVTVFLDEGDLEKALSTAKEALSAAPDNADAHERLGLVLLKKGEFENALAAFNEALKINPNFRQAKTGAGLALLGKGDVAGAEKTLTAALVLNPYPAMTHYALGLVYQKMNDDAKALAHFKEGLKTYKEGKR